MSTSIPTSNATSSASPTSRPPTIHLPLVPNQSAGPFVLGSSLHRTLAYLRSSNPSSTSTRSGVPPNLLFPSVEVAYDDDEQQDGGDAAALGGISKAAQQPWSSSPSSSSMTGLSPIRVRPCPGVDLIFSTPQVNGNSGGGDSIHQPTAPVGPPRLQCIVVALGGHNESQEEETEDAELYREEQYRRPILVTYKGQRLEEIRGGGGGVGSSGGRLTRGFIQQVFGPTYPAKRYKQGDGLHAVATTGATSKTTAAGAKTNSATAPAASTSTSLRNKWLIQYPGLAFLFDDAAVGDKGASRTSGAAAGDVSKDARPTHLVLHHGDDALHPTELAWPIVAGPFGAGDEATTSSSKDSSLPLFNTAFTPSAANVSDSEPVPSGTLILHSARLLPGRGVDLSLLCAPFPAPAAVPQLATVSLRLGETRQQDVLLALGPAERRWGKEPGEREGTAEARLPRGGAGGREDGDGEEADEEEGSSSKDAQAGQHDSRRSGDIRGEFWSYPSLGFDLLFYHSSFNTHSRPQRRPPIDNLADDLSDFDEDFDVGAADGGSSRGAILGKIVVHSDVPGSALWGRYECVPWYIEEDEQEEAEDRRDVAVKTASAKGSTSKSKSKSGRATSSATDEKSRPSSGSGSGSGNSSSDERRRPLPKVTASSDQTRRTQGAPRRIDRTTPPSQLRTPTFSFLHRNQTPHSTATTHLETMHLDRSADEHEFHPSRGTLRLDVRTSLEGFPGAVAEVLLKRRGEGQGQGQGEGEDTPAVVVGWTIVEG